MDGSQYRDSRAAERRVINNSQQQEPAARLQFPKDAPARPAQGANPSQRSPRRKRSFKGLLTTAIVLLIVVAVVLAGWFVWNKFQSAGTAIDSSKYQAVALLDGQNYFGKLSDLNDDYMKLTNVHYLQPQQSGDTTEGSTTTNQNFTLTKFTDVVYGPEDEIIIRKDSILFYENLDPNGDVAQGINQLNNSH